MRDFSPRVLLVMTAVLASTLTARGAVPPRAHALINAQVVTSAAEEPRQLTVVLRDGLIEAVGPDLESPPDARVWDLEGLHVFPGLIDPYVSLAVINGTEKRSEGNDDRGEEVASWERPFGFHPERRAADALRPSSKAVEKLRRLGFTLVGVVPDEGLMKGSAAVLALGDGPLSRSLLSREGAQVVRLADRGWEAEGYPHSLMGVIAAVRQALYDARWYREAHAAYARHGQGMERPLHSPALEALDAPSRGIRPMVFEGDGPLLAERIRRLGAELGLDAWMLASGHEHVRLDLVRAARLPLIVPLDFPDPPAVFDDQSWHDVPLGELRHWRYAPATPGWLAEAGVELALTSHGLEDPKDFPEHLRRAIRHGLDPVRALNALTRVPARFLGLDDRLGSLESGKIANLTITDGPLFGRGTRVRAVWVDGEPYEQFEPEDEKKSKSAFEGRWLLLLPEANPVLRIEREEEAWTAVLEAADGAGQDEALELVEAGPSRLVLSTTRMLIPSQVDGPQRVTLEPRAAELLSVRIEDDAGASLEIVALRREPGEEGQPEAPPRHEGGPLAEPRTVLVRGATIWTQGPDGILEAADLLIRDGKVTALAHGLEAPSDAHVIEAEGKHVTPGIIDAHSHMGIEGNVNEGTLSVTAHVRIGDVIDSEDRNLYRSLAGGLTAANLLHGSANAIGGQNAVIKLRWGLGPEELMLEAAPPGIKFALGENPKQANWGDKYKTRFPQTRMGVEQTIRAAFLEALDHRRRHEQYRALGKRERARQLPPQPNLVLDTLLEILDGERAVHPHSYRQDEILMLIRVAEEFGFTVGTFQHVLEGYKVADELATHGAAASCFSDWWAYKFEVYDAIPYAGALMWERGVLVSFNSDSAELSRRLNLEAAKAVKYGGVPEPEALAFVTLNSARQLGVEDRIGSLEPGKDGDFVLWSASPLDGSTKALETWIDGKLYFDREHDLAARDALRDERERLETAARQAAKHQKKSRWSGKGRGGSGAYDPTREVGCMGAAFGAEEVAP